MVLAEVKVCEDKSWFARAEEQGYQGAWTEWNLHKHKISDLQSFGDWKSYAFPSSYGLCMTHPLHHYICTLKSSERTLSVDYVVRKGH